MKLKVGNDVESLMNNHNHLETWLIIFFHHNPILLWLFSKGSISINTLQMGLFFVTLDFNLAETREVYIAYSSECQNTLVTDKYRLFEQELAMKNLLVNFAKDESGATAIEYGLIAAGISVAIIVVVGQLGDQLNTTFTTVKNALQ